MKECKWKTMEEIPLVLTVQDIMEVLHIGRESAYRLVRSNKLDSIRIDGKIRVTREALISYLRKKDNVTQPAIDPVFSEGYNGGDLKCDGLLGTCCRKESIYG